MSLRDRITARLRKMGGPGLERGDRHATVLSVASNKGGVGKTTTAVHLSLGFAEAGARVLLVDLDPQAHVSASLGIEPPAGNGTVSEVLRGALTDLAEASYPSGYEGLSLAGSEKDLSETEAMIAAKIGKELLLAGALEVAATHFDLIVFDCPPNLGTLTLNALCAGDALLIPCDMSVLALEGVGDILTAVDTVRRRLQRQVEVLGIVATRFDRRTRSVNDTVVQSLGELYGDRI
ncbi:MAG: AAA family ATPase, partial [Myxococcota bacterium]